MTKKIKRNKLKEGDLVYITWYDHFSHNGWLPQEQTRSQLRKKDEERGIKVHSIGWLFQETKYCYTIYNSWYDGYTEGYLKILKPTVIKVKKLNDPSLL